VKTVARVMLAGVTFALLSCQTQESNPSLANSAPTFEASGPYRLLTGVAPRSNTLANFGIDLSSVSDRDAEIVQSAWKNFEIILNGKAPTTGRQRGSARLALAAD